MLYILASAFIFSIFQVTSAEISKVLSAGTALPIEYIGSTLIVLTLYWRNVRKDFNIIKANYKNTLQKGFFASGSTLLYYLFAYIAYSLAPDRGVVVLLLTTQVIVTVVLGLLFLKEREGIKRKLLAAGISVAASIMIKV